MEDGAYEHNEYIEMAVADVRRTGEAEAFARVLDVLLMRMSEGGEAPMPMLVSQGSFPFPEISDTDNIEEVVKDLAGKSFTLEEDVRFRMDTMKDTNGRLWIPLFTSEHELHKQPTTNISMNISIEQILKAGLNYEEVEGVVINPFGEFLELPRNIIELTLSHYKGSEETD